MVPMIPPLPVPPSGLHGNNYHQRRKRGDDDSSNRGTGGDDDSSSEFDSIRPVVSPRKRRRTITDAFQSISLANENTRTYHNNQCLNSRMVPASGGEIDDDADSSQAVADGTAEDEYYYTSTSSLEDEEDDDPGKEDSKAMILSDLEEAERKAQRQVMLELVFGSRKTAPEDPVDRKLQELVRQSLQEASQNTSTITQDDMQVSYNRPGIESFYLVCRRPNESETSTNKSFMQVDFDSSSTIQRCNSLPNLFARDESMDDATMEID